MASGLPWALACAALAAAWTVATASRAPRRNARWCVRVLLAGALSLGAAHAAYAVLGWAGVELAWNGLTGGRALGVTAALLVGVVEESAKLLGVVVAHERRGSQHVMRAIVGVAALFAIGEAFLAVEGGPWAIALGRAALAPVGHASLAAPFAWAIPLRTTVRVARWPLRAALLRVAAALAAATLLHGIGDWCLGAGGWGRALFAVTMAAPAVWLYASRGTPVGVVAALGSVRRSARSSSATPQACAMQPRGV